MAYPFDVFMRNCCQILLNGTHADVYRSISKGLLHLKHRQINYMWYEYQQASMYRKHRRSLQSKIFAFKKLFYHIVLTVQPRLDQISVAQIAVR